MFDRPAIINSGSTLVRTAVELAQRHPPRPGIDDEPWCVRCWAPWPCVAARHAAEVCQAAGLDAAEPYWLESPRLRPTQLEPSLLEPSWLQPSRAEPTRLELPRLTPSWLEPAHQEPPHVEPRHLEPPGQEPDWLESAWLEADLPDDPFTTVWRLRTPVHTDRQTPTPVFAESRTA
jgi:hypothetical protein